MHFFNTVMDTLLVELRRRFSPSTCAIVRGVGALSPKSASFLQDEVLKEMASHCGCVAEDLKCEVHQSKKLLERKAASGTIVTSVIEFAELMYVALS